MANDRNNPVLAKFKAFCAVETSEQRKKEGTGKNKVGAPTKYKPEYVQLVYGQCLLGKIDKELATFFAISEAQFNVWKKKYPEFAESIKAGKDIANAKVADSLYQAAIGYEHDSEEIKVVSAGNGEGSYIERVPVKKKYAPNVLAGIFFLKNRQPDLWRDKQEIDHSGTLSGTLEVKIVRAKDPDSEETK